MFTAGVALRRGEAGERTIPRGCAPLYGVETVTALLLNVFGPRQDPSSPYSGVISIFVDRALRREPVTVFGDGSQSRDFVFVEDVVDANLRAAAAPAASGRVYNVATGRVTTVNELAAMLGRVVGREVAIAYQPPRQGDILHSLADIGRARADLGYEPKTAIETGLERLVEHVRRTRS